MQSHRIQIPTTENQKDMKKHFLDLIGVSCISWLCKSMIKVLNKQNLLVCKAWMSQGDLLGCVLNSTWNIFKDLIHKKKEKNGPRSVLVIVG